MSLLLPCPHCQRAFDIERALDALHDPALIRYARTNKFDIQLAQAMINERRLGDILLRSEIARGCTIELKSERHQWEQTGNICIEYRRDDQPSGISVSAADWWVHELRRDNDTLAYLWLHMDRMKALARTAIRGRHFRRHAGDGGRQSVALVNLGSILG